jgi:hypothetical protein
MEFITYKKFSEPERAIALTDLLSSQGIEFHLTEDRESLDSLYGDKLLNKQFFVKIKKEDFAKADTILLTESAKELETVEKDHYLFSFTDEELFDILTKPDEWNEFDYQLAKKILLERGKDISTDTVDLLRKQRISELAKPEEGQRNWIYAGYLFALLGGLLGIFIGWHLSTFKKTLPNGEKVFGYTQKDQQHGKRIFIIGIIMFTVWVTIRILRSEYN